MSFRNLKKIKRYFCLLVVSGGLNKEHIVKIENNAIKSVTFATVSYGTSDAKSNLYSPNPAAILCGRC